MGTPLMDRIRVRGPEADVSTSVGMDVSRTVVDNNGPRPPARVPEWIRRMSEDGLPAKDTTGTVTL